MRLLRLTVVAVAAVALLAGCSAGGSGSTKTTGDLAAKEAAATQPLRVGTMIPMSLFPANSSGAYAFEVLDNLYDGLVRFSPKDGSPVMMVAKSIKTTDSKVYNVVLKDDQYFSNGEQITADTFMQSWSQAADTKNAYANSAKFNEIVGYGDLPNMATPELSGITIKDKLNFSITLNQPDSQFIYSLGTSAFYPVPSTAWADVKAFTAEPIGNGPYKMAEPWTGGSQIKLVRSDKYSGTKAKNPGITFTIYTDLATAWTDFQAGELDVAPITSPPDALTAQQQLGDKFVREPVSAQFNYMMLPTYLDPYDDAKVREALSMAIDRKTIISTFFDKATVGLTDFGVPASIGYRTTTKLPYLSYNPKEAKALWKEVGDKVGTISIGVPANYGYEDWTQAIMKNWHDVLGVDTGTIETLPSVSTVYKDKTYPNPVIRSRYSDTPSASTILVQQFTKNGTANWSGWTDDEVQAQIQKALAASSTADATKEFDTAKDMLMKEMPIIPLWSLGDSYALSDRVQDFPTDPYNKSNYRDVPVVDSTK